MSRFAFIIGLLSLISRRQSLADLPSYEYDEYYYAETYEEEGEAPATTAASLQHHKKLASTSHREKEFRGMLTCSEESMTLNIKRTSLPRGLSIDKRSFHNAAVTRGDSSSRAEPCVHISRNATNFIYKVTLDCQHAVGELRFGSVVVYSHEAMLIEAGGSPGSRDLYTIVMDCETALSTSRKGVLPYKWVPEYRLFEHREGNACVKAICPYGDLCLRQEGLDGYFCTCPANVKFCECPRNFYACARPENTSEPVGSLLCIRNSRLCDKRFDCPLQDDELCADMWTPWSAWSSCNSSCGKGSQIRERACTHSFTNDPSRCSRRCDPDQELHDQQQERTCNNGPCSAVHCGSEFMTVTVPLQHGRFSEDRVHLKNDDDRNCRPIVNSTHALFAIPLHECNTSTWLDGDLVFYSNEIIYEVDKNPSSLIVREFGHSYVATCQYKRRQTVGLRMLDANPGSVLVDVPVMKFIDQFGALKKDAERLDIIEHHTSGDGEFEFRMDIFTDSTYQNKYRRQDYPLQKRLGERLYVAVTFTSQDEDLHVFIERCWATASGENGMAQNDTKYQFIDDGCPLDPTIFFHNHDNSHFSDRYSIESFKFNDPERWYVYFLCQVVLCEVDEHDDECHRECDSAQGNDTAISPGRQRREARAHPTYAHVMQGPIVVLEEDQFSSHRKRSGPSAGTIQHKVLTRFDVQNKYGNQSPVNTQSWWNSPFAIGAVAGIVCMVVGLAVGLRLGRRKTERQQI